MREKEPSNPLAARLRELRQASGLSQAEAARRAGISKYTLSRAETGTFAPKPEVVKRLCAVYGVATEVRDDLVQRFEDLREETTAMRVTLGRGGWPMQERLRRIEEDSALVRVYSVMIPGPFQTEAYIRAVMAPFLQGADLERTVQSRLARQQLLDEGARKFHFVMQEGALSWPMLDPGGMVAQLERLLEVVPQRPNVTLAVIPKTTTTPFHPVSGFYVYDRTAAVTTTANATVIMRSEKDLADYDTSFKRFDGLAERGEAALTVVARVAAEYRAQLT